ncbi:MAG TPA: YARHG domain-containing protein [Cyclobacteriaceae bacterium]|nr:YARHG domain-containing protein [Cyclobacteriaceae bacterium]
MNFRILLFAALLPASAFCQQLEVVKFVGQFSEKGKEILPEYRAEFYDPSLKKPTGPIKVESPLIPFGSKGGSLLIVSTDDPYGFSPKRRLYLFSMWTLGAHSLCISILTDNVDASFEKIADDILVFTGIEKGKPVSRVLAWVNNRVVNAKIAISYADYPTLLNKVLAKSTFKMSAEEAQAIIKDKEWGAARLKRLLAENSITAAEEKALQILVVNAPRARGYLTDTMLVPFISVKETSVDPASVWTSLVKMEDSPRGIDSCYVNIDGIPIADGKIIGVTRALVSDKGPKVTYSFAWFSGTQMGKVLFLESDSRSPRQPLPDVSIIRERFIKIVSHDGSGKPKAHYGVLSDYDLFLLSDVPKDEMAFHRNYIFARYGYNFKNPVYQNYFSVFDWYKPELDDAEAANKLMTSDERAIVTQLADLEKTAK